jgi:hypothetical protein
VGSAGRVFNTRNRGATLERHFSKRVGKSEASEPHFAEHAFAEGTIWFDVRDVARAGWPFWSLVLAP